MTTFEALILGIIQGITEFLPISSSGHLELFQSLLGLKNLHLYVFFDLVCHLGTLLAIFCVFRQQIKQAILYDRKKLLQVVLGTLPLFPLVLLLHPIKSLFDKPEILGFAFLFTALLLYLGTQYGKIVDEKVLEKRTWRDALIIGTFQAVAIIPGVSRSGSTISGALLLGWNAKDAATYSFLLAIPAILGGCTIELLDYLLYPAEPTGVTALQYILGFLSAFVVGYFALLLVMQLAVRHKFHYFIWYCLFLGISTLIYFN